jgi:hypothetical protein
MKYDLSVIIPSINPDKLCEVHDYMMESIGKYTCEMIYVGPALPPQVLYEKSNFKFYLDKGCPARCFQLGTFFADGEYLSFVPDDAHLQKDALSNCIDLMKKSSTKDGITMRFSEGIGRTGTQDQDDAYWIAHTHDDLRKLPGVHVGWRTANMFMYNTLYFRELGGLDCRFEHVNMNSHDLAFRVQKAGGKIHPSPTKVSALDWYPHGPETIMFQTYIQNDEPLFRALYSIDDPTRLRIDYNNWINAPSAWPRRYK